MSREQLLQIRSECRIMLGHPHLQQKTRDKLKRSADKAEVLLMLQTAIDRKKLRQEVSKP